MAKFIELTPVEDMQPALINVNEIQKFFIHKDNGLCVELSIQIIPIKESYDQVKAMLEVE